jgi:hypothetical protein
MGMDEVWAAFYASDSMTIGEAEALAGTMLRDARVLSRSADTCLACRLVQEAAHVLETSRRGRPDEVVPLGDVLALQEVVETVYLSVVPMEAVTEPSIPIDGSLTYRGLERYLSELVSQAMDVTDSPEVCPTCRLVVGFDAFFVAVAGTLKRDQRDLPRDALLTDDQIDDLVTVAANFFEPILDAAEDDEENATD